MLHHWVLRAHFELPSWLQAPSWIAAADHAVREFITAHQAAGLFSVIFAEELGVPLPVPGDVAIILGGFMTTQGRLSYPVSYLCVIAGATTGGTLLFTLGRRYGHRLMSRYGRFIGIDHQRMARAESALNRWGAWAVIIGRLIPGMRIVLSALAGSFQMRYRVFVPSVVVSSTIWAAIFLELGRKFGRRALELFRLFPAHLLPWALLVLLIGALLFTGYQHGLFRHGRRPAGDRIPIPPDAP